MTALLMRCRSAGRSFEVEVVVLITLVAGIYFARLGDLPLRGEESRWAQVAREMLTSGDWVVPRQQGLPFLSRPPLQSWLIALAAQARGELDAFAVRLPAATAVLLITLLVYAYSRLYLNRLGALAAACALATFSQVLQLGRYAETEACFMLLVSGPLLVWHYGYTRGWPRPAVWLAAYSLVALGALTKGTQAPVYFIGGVGLYLLWRRDWRWLLSAGHALGILGFVLIIAAWQWPCYLEVGWQGVRAVWGGDSSGRLLHPRPASEVALRYATYPFEIAGCLLPWSILLLAYLSRAFRAALDEARPMVGFLAVCLLVALPTCWFVPGTMTRFFLPMYPCLAPLVGLVVQRLAADPRWQGLAYQRLLGMLALFMAGVAAIVLAQSWLPLPAALQPFQQPGWFALLYAALAGGLAWTLWQARMRFGPTPARTAVLCLVCFLGLTYNGPILNAMLQRSEQAASAVEELKHLLPPGQRLVSFGPVHHLFAYYFGEPIEQHPNRPRPQDCRDVVYFCCDARDGLLPKLPFAWEAVGVVSMDRNRHAVPSQAVVVGRRLNPARAADSE
ncbi:MAG: glycosyltransferase family 39 protein [Planctomycetia bacterium]|nr:glycosyltransferase family 39 protein [Planctomycetia bacterium]